MGHYPSRGMLIASLLLGMLGAMIFPTAAEASIFVVNTNDDLDDGQCDVSHCSLREAINAANANSGLDQIHFDLPGSGGSTNTINLDSALPALTDDGTTINGTTEPDYAGSPVIFIHKATGTLEIEVGLALDSNDNEIIGLELVGFGIWLDPNPVYPNDLAGGAIVISGSGNLIQNNTIGQGAWWNSIGVRLSGPGNSVIGNVISGNGGGIIADQPNNVIQGNLIGPAADGVTPVNNNFGVFLDSGAGATLLGGAAPGEGNVISANHGFGVHVDANNTNIFGNFIGLNASGDAALPNGGNGVVLYGDYTQFGGNQPGQGNVVSGNQYNGLWISISCAHCFVQGNKIGTDASGTLLIPNGSSGIESEADQLIVGGTSPADGNLIKGNGWHGLYIDDLAGSNFVAHNTIAQNGGDGIELSQDVDQNTFTQNSIYDNAGLGIDQNGTENNNGIDYPQLDSASGSTISGTACSNCLIEFFVADPDPTGYGEGMDYLDYVFASSNGSFSAQLSGLGFCTPITATATDGDGNTSEFSQNVHARCLRVGPIFLYPIWTFIIVVFGVIGWRLRRWRPSMPAASAPIFALGGGALFLFLALSLPFVEPEFTPKNQKCGNGVVDSGETCDGDDLTMCLSGQVCQNCQCITEVEWPICGDGDVDEGEQCDGDDLSMCLSGQVCENCKCITYVDLCGNGVVDNGEQCDGDDLSMCLSGQVCDNCKCITMMGMCGNGVVEEGEQCDGDDLSMCLSGQVCENCKCITHVDAEPEICVYEALQNNNCRASDYPESELVETLMEGDSADLIALNPEYTHGLFDLENGKQCWVWLGLMAGDENPFGNCPVKIIDPPEALRESACNADLVERECIAAGGEWVEGMAAPYCACPEE